MRPQDTPDSGGEPDEPTVSLSSDPPAGQSPLDEFLQEPMPPPVPPEPRRREQRHPAYYVSLTVAVMLTLGLIAGLAVLSANPPANRVAGSAGSPNVPQLPPPTDSTPPGATTTASATPGDPYAELAAHPLSTSTTPLPDQRCALPRFDPADAAQAEFYQATKVCAESAFGVLLSGAGLPATPIDVVTVQGGPVQTPCGTVEASAPATQCLRTVYMTPAHLRDVEGNDRYPGRYFGVFLREYARAVLENEMQLLDRKVEDTADLDARIARQATCVVGIVSAAMDGRGAVDANITNEIRARLSEVDATPDAASWLDRGFRSRQLAACNSWT